jgi:hypothetical protein
MKGVHSESFFALYTGMIKQGMARARVWALYGCMGAASMVVGGVGFCGAAVFGGYFWTVGSLTAYKRWQEVGRAKGKLS